MSSSCVMLALLTLTVSVCYIMLLRQESRTFFVSRDTLSVCKEWDPLSGQVWNVPLVLQSK